MFVSARSTVRRSLRKSGFALLLATSCALTSNGIFARSPASESAADVAPVEVASLPREAIVTLQLIRQGGPFPHQKDGTVFGNRERMLPIRPRGHYREYTVRTLGVRTRGARRIVCGGQPPTAPETCYYTANHYSSFSRIVH